ncbi:MAG: GFA family protein [Methyloceanibacter sp.]
MAITGGCLCGAVRYAIEAEKPLGARTCWCRFCQHIGAGSATVNVAFPADSVRIEGTLADFTGKADSGNIMHGRFCPTCGTHVTIQAEARPHLLAIRAGTLDDPEIARPAMTIWTAQAPSWAAIDPNIPQDQGQPPPPQPKA